MANVQGLLERTVFKQSDKKRHQKMKNRTFANRLSRILLIFIFTRKFDFLFVLSMALTPAFGTYLITKINVMKLPSTSMRAKFQRDMLFTWAVQ